MTVIVGGLRQRLIRDSIYNMLHAALSDLGWFDTGRQHQPINMRASAVASDEEIPLNTLALAPENLEPPRDAELGTNLAEHRRVYYVDFYAESEVIGEHLAGDVRDIFDGRIPSIDRYAPHVAVWDYRQATPPFLFYVQLEDVQLDRAHDFPKPYQRYWYAVRATVIDTYGDDSDDGALGESPYPGPSLYPGP